MENNKINLFTFPEEYDWIYKDNPVIIPSKGRGTTEVKFVSEQSKKNFMIKINMKK